MKNSTNSINTYFECPQKFDLTYNKKIEPILDDAGFEAAYGRAFHGLLEGDETHIGHFGPKWQAVIREHYACYQKAWLLQPDWTLEYDVTEIKFEFDLADGYTFHGIADGVAKLGDGKNYLVESKTTGMDIEQFLEQKSHVVQPGLYLLAAKHAPALQHYDIAGIIYDVTNRPTIKQKRGESDDAYVQRVSDWFFERKETAFKRELITRTPEYLDDLAGELMMTTDLQRSNMFPKNRNACYNWRRQCGFWEACFAGVKPEPNHLYQIRKHR